MSDETTQTSTNLTLSDPVDPETLEQLAHLERSQSQVSVRNMELEKERVRLVRSSIMIDSERQKLFEKILMDRGLPPNAVVQIDATTGSLSMQE